MAAVDFDEVKAHLNITTDTNDDELASIIYAAEAVIAQRVGPLEQTTVTSTVTSGDGCSIVLPATPVASVTSVTATRWGVDSTVTPLSFESTSGVVRFYSQDSGRYASNTTYTVVYEAGYEILPDNLALAVKELVRHLWKSQRGASARPGSPDQMPAAGFLIPNAVAELIEPNMTFGFA